MERYIFLDAGPLADFLDQYFRSSKRLCPFFVKSSEFSDDIAQMINKIIQDPQFSRICASSFAFVELVRKWEEIVKDRFKVYQLQAFISDPPEWFLIEPLDETIVHYLCLISPEVRMADNSMKPLEWTDAIHAATKMTRENSILVTSDERLRQVRY